MFLEISQPLYQKIRELLQVYNLSYEISDCTLPNETEKYVHLEFTCDISDNIRGVINKKLDELYLEIRNEYEKSNLSQVFVENIEKDKNEGTNYENERT